MSADLIASTCAERSAEDLDEVSETEVAEACRLEEDGCRWSSSRIAGEETMAGMARLELLE